MWEAFYVISEIKTDTTLGGKRTENQCPFTGMICASLVQRCSCAKQGIPGQGIGSYQIKTQVLILLVSLCSAVHFT